jgi:hypothetical protein
MLLLRRTYSAAYPLKEFHHSISIHHNSPSSGHIALWQIKNYSEPVFD